MADGGDGAPLLAADEAPLAHPPSSLPPAPAPAAAPPVITVDGEALDAAAARSLARNLFRAGWCGLPALWLLNAWLFWPAVRAAGGDPVVATYARRSGVGAALSAALILPWAAAFTLGGPRLVGQALFDRLNVAGLDLDAYGLRF